MSSRFKWSHAPTVARNHQPEPEQVKPCNLIFICHTCNHEWQGPAREIVTCPSCNGIRVTSTRTYSRILPRGRTSQERNLS